MRRHRPKWSLQLAKDLPAGLHGADALNVGDRIDLGSVTVTAKMIDDFAALTGDRFAIHMSDEAAQAHGFDRRVAHGLLVLSLVDRLKNAAPAQIRARASMSWNWTFRRPVLAGDTLSAELTISSTASAKATDQAILTLEFIVTDQAGDVVQRGTNRLLAYR